MKISIFGMGYVGVVSGACFAKIGHTVIGVDVNPVKVDLINKGKSPIIEKELPELVASVVAKGNFSATTNTNDAIKRSDISIICVGTPSNANGSLNLNYILKVCEEIGQALRAKKGYHIVSVRSTVLPGSMEKVIIPKLEASSGKKSGRDFGVCMNPEFMREGSSVFDFSNPPFTLIGSSDKKAIQAVASLYEKVNAPVIKTSFKIAEFVKYVCNAFHALKITFSNEIGNLCKEMGVDSHEVMNIFSTDTKLNISKAYLKPGFAFGGSCLPKDLRALLYKAKELDIEPPLLKSILPSNQLQIQRAIDMIMRSRKKNIGIIGLSFKAGTDDLRESPMVLLVEYLIGKGYKIKIFDKNVSISKLIGANKEYIQQQIPHISSLLSKGIKQVINFAEVVVIGNAEAEFIKALKNIDHHKTIIDLARIVDKSDEIDYLSQYQGLCW